MHVTRFSLRVSAILLAAIVLCASSNRAQAASLDTVPDHVLGQSNFILNSANQGGAISASGLSNPNAIAIDRRSGRIWVADFANNRVLSYPSTASTGSGLAADLVLGQTDFVSGTANNGGISASSLNAPLGIAVDGSGNVFVSDQGNRRILMYKQPVTTHAAASLVIGQADFTSSGAGVTAATLASPTRLAFDSNGNLFVADFGNSRVLSYVAPFTNGMNATLVLGQPDFVSNTSNNGGISATSLANPEDVVFDASNNLYVADTSNNRVLQYTAPFFTHAAATKVYGQANVLTTATANNGGLSASSLSNPRGISLDPFNNLYIADLGNNRVVEYNSGSTAAASRVFGQPDFVTGTPNTGGVASGLSNPFACVNDNVGNLLIADLTNNRVLEYDLPITAAAPTLTALSPAVMAAGSSAFVLYVTGKNFINTSVVQVNGVARPTTFTGFSTLTAAIPASDVANLGVAAITVMTPAPGGGTSALLPISIYSRNPNDTLADRVFGQPDFATGTSSTGGVSAHSLNQPYDLTIDKTGRLWVCEINNSRVLSWASADALTDGQDADFVLGQPDFVSTAPGTTATSLKFPGGVQVDSAGNVYVADTGNARVLIFNDPLHTDGVADVVFGQADFVSGLQHKGGAVSASGLSGPYGMVMDAAGNLYVVDYNDNRVLRYAPPFVTNMNATQVFGQPDFVSNTSNNGGASASSLGGPGYAAIDSAGNLYISDYNNNRVLEYNSPTTDTVADHVFGQPDFTTVTPNTGGLSAQSMASPDGVAVDSADNLYVTDRSNNRILVFNSPLTSTGMANRVFGQGGIFTSNTSNNGGRSASSLSGAVGLAFDTKHNLYVCDVSNNRVLSYDHPLETLPVVTSAAQATPSTVLIGQPVNFTVAGADPDNDVLTYTWDFGDGSTGTGATVSHTYQVAGVINVTVTIDDGVGGTVTSSVMVTVKAPNPLGDVKLAVKLNFAKANSDMISTSGTLELLAGDLNGKQATVQIADLIETFKIAKTAKNADGTFSVSSKGTAARAAKFKLKLAKKTFAAALVSAGLVNATGSTPVHVPITITLDGTVYQTTVTSKYTAKKGVSGSAK
jgi:sugar lactone lactonase YvrE